MTETDISTPAIFDTLGIAVTVHDPQTGEIIDVNDRYAVMFGYDADDFRELRVEDISADGSSYSQERAEQLVRAAGNGRPQEFEWHAKTATNEYFWTHVKLQAASLDGRECVIATVRDITGVKEREQQLQLFHRILRHNLRNSMNVITGSVRQLLENLEDDELREYATTVHETATEVTSLSSAATTIEEISDSTGSELAPVEVTTALSNAVADIRDAHSEATIEIVETADVTVHANECLELAIRQLLENAIVHNDSAAPTVRAQVQERASEGEVWIDVADDGPRIPESERIMFSDQIPRSDVTHGDGVGLWTVLFCVGALRGQLHYEEREPTGNRVRISVPRIATDASR